MSPEKIEKMTASRINVGEQLIYEDDLKDLVEEGSIFFNRVSRFQDKD